MLKLTPCEKSISQITHVEDDTLGDGIYMFYWKDKLNNDYFYRGSAETIREYLKLTKQLGKYFTDIIV